MHLDSFVYRVLWKFKRAFRFKNRGPNPIVWGLF